MAKYFLLLFLSCYTFITQAQINGRLINSHQQPIPKATIKLFDTGNKEIANTYSDSTGAFVLNYKNKGTLLITHAGYKTYKVTVGNSDLGNILLEEESKQLDSVTLTTKQKIVELEGNSLIFHVNKTISAQGVSAFEVLQKAPGVYIDNNNDISLQGKRGVLILLDGKQTYVSGRELVDLLRSMPSSSIRSIEITTSPGAKYDAAGSAGIINIRTNKSLVKGLSGTVTAGAAYGISPKQNFDGLLTYRKNKWNLYGGYNHFLGYGNYIYGSDRIQNNIHYTSFTDDVDKRQRMSGRAGADYTINKKNTIGILFSGNFLFGGGLTNTKTQIGGDKLLTASNDYYYQQTNRYNTNVNYRYEDSSGHLFSVDADYGNFKKGNSNLQANIYTDANHTITDQRLYRSHNHIAIQLKAVKADYTAPLWKGTIETGAKYSSVATNNTARFFHVLHTTDSIDERRTNNFTFKESIAAAYISYKKNLGKWSLQAGLRMENASSTGRLSATIKGVDSVEQIKRNFTNLFPSFSVSVQPSDVHNFSLAYTTRIDRPAYPDLNPFIYLLDELSFWQGNPFLQPQRTNRITLQYAYNNSTILSVNYAHTSNFSTRITDTLEQTKLVMVPRNLGVQENWSLSLTQLFSPVAWWNITYNGTLYHLNNTISFDAFRNFNLSQTAARMNLQQTFKLPYSFTGEIFASYVSRRLTGANEFSRGVSQVDLGLQKLFASGKIITRIAFIDIYKGSPFNSVQEFDGFYLRNYGYFESRQVRLNLTYKFNNSKAPRSRVSALENENSRVK